MGNMSGSYGEHYTLWQSITVNSQNIAENYSNVTVKMYLTFDGSSYYAFTNSETYGTMSIDGYPAMTYGISNLAFSSGQAKTITLATWNGNIGHSADGTKKLVVTGTWDTDTSRIGSGSCSTSSILATIPRTSSISCSSGNIGSNTTIVINRASASFTHTLTYQFGTLSGTIATKTSATSVNFALPNDFYKMIPNSKSGTGTISCTTYSGNTVIGSSSTSFVANAVESVSKPTLTTTLTDTNSKTIALTGNNKIMVLNASIGSLVISTTLQKNAGSIKSVTVNGTNVGTGASITKTYSPVKTSTFTIVVTDSRGYSTTVKLSPTVKNYIVPTVNATFSRPSPTTGQINLKYSGNWFNGSFGSVTNTLTVSYKWKLSTNSSYTKGTTTITPTNSGNAYSRSSISLGTSFTYTNSYDFVLTISDKINTITYSQRVSQGLPIIQWNKDKFKVNGKAYINSRLVKAYMGVAVDFDTALTTGIYQVNSSTKNPPYANPYGFLSTQVMNGDTWNQQSNWIWQVFYSTATSRIYSRRAVNGGNWSKWANILEVTTLYDNSSGTTGTITLNETAANFTYLEIFYFYPHWNGTLYGSTKIYSADGKLSTLGTDLQYNDNGTMFLKWLRILISGTALNVKAAGSAYYGSTSGTDTTNGLKIYRVVGYR